MGSIFSDTPPKFSEKISKVQNTKNTQGQITQELIGFSQDYTPDPIIIIGTAGAGKTTFIKNFIDLEIDSILIPIEIYTLKNSILIVIVYLLKTGV